jgi:membrane protein YdbS with pleckstrin-like domain
MTASNPLFPSPNQLAVEPEQIAAIRRYSRLATGAPALVLLLLPIPLVRVVHGFFDNDSARPWLIAASICCPILAIAFVILNERRLRSYDLQLSDTAITFERGGSRSQLPFAHVQLLDRETSPLLSRFQLCRCNLHTAGGMIAIDPIPINLSLILEQRILRLQSTARADA